MRLNFASYDLIVVNTSAGKDSQTTLLKVVERARACGVLDRVVAVHSDLGRMEWDGVKELAHKQCEHYGVPLVIVKRPGDEDLLGYIERRGKWPDAARRFCTSDFKRDPVSKFIRNRVPAGRVLNCMGMRASESPARSKLKAFEIDKRLTTKSRRVDRWLPIHKWSLNRVWKSIKESGVPYHPIYDVGMPRLSCKFCIFAPKAALIIAGQHDPELLADYVRVERKIDHKFRLSLPIAEVKSALDSGEKVEKIPDWRM